MSRALRRLREDFGVLPWVFRQSWKGMWRDDVPFYAAGIAFHSLFSIFSLLFLLTIVLGLVGLGPERLRTLIHVATGVVPVKVEEFLDLALDVVRKPVPAQLLPVAIVTMFWTSSNVVGAVIHALNRIYHLQEGRAAWRTRLIALTVVGLSSAFLVVAFLIVVFGGDSAGVTEEVRRLRGEIVGFALRWNQSLSVAVVFLAARLLYWLAPSFRHEHRVSWPGSLVFAVSWSVATTGFNFYLREIAVYDHVYGPMATVVVLLVWVYLSAFLLLFGGEVNAAYHRRRLAASAPGLFLGPPL